MSTYTTLISYQLVYSKCYYQKLQDKLNVLEKIISITKDIKVVFS